MQLILSEPLRVCLTLLSQNFLLIFLYESSQIQCALTQVFVCKSIRNVSTKNEGVCLTLLSLNFKIDFSKDRKSSVPHSIGNVLEISALKMNRRFFEEQNNNFGDYYPSMMFRLYKRKNFQECASQYYPRIFSAKFMTFQEVTSRPAMMGSHLLLSH